MPKTILLPEQLVKDKTQWPKVIVLQECESRDSKGNLLAGWYYFAFDGKFYVIYYQYKHHKVIKSSLFYV